MGQEGPRRIAIQSVGTRGDIQPYIAIACALKAKGYVVAVFTNVGHKTFVEEFGLTFYGCYVDTEKLVRETPALQESMATGSTMKFIKGVNEVVESTAPDSIDKYLKGLKEFAPDLVIEGTLSFWFGVFARLRLNIPTMNLYLQAITNDRKRCCFGFPTLPCGLHRYIVWYALVGGLYDQFPVYDKIVKHHGYGGVCDIYSREDFINDVSRRPIDRTVFIAGSLTFNKILNPEASNFRFLGNCVIDKAAQLATVKSFGGDSNKDAENFIKAGPKPIYCGWGSMTCRSREHMIVLVVKALSLCKQRAIVLGGWADLDLQLLKQTSRDNELIEYAEQNILFVNAVSHEWLFPQVACTVHHGGAGTTAAAMRAGRPTIITPVWLDQYDFAHLTNELGVGIGMNKQFQKISPQELAEAITKVVTSIEMAEEAKALGERLCKEHGTEESVRAVEKFWKEQVATGKHEAYVKDRLARLKTEPSCLCGCLPACFKPR